MIDYKDVPEIKEFVELMGFQTPAVTDELTADYLVVMYTNLPRSVAKSIVNRGLLTHMHPTNGLGFAWTHNSGIFVVEFWESNVLLTYKDLK